MFAQLAGARLRPLGGGAGGGGGPRLGKLTRRKFKTNYSYAGPPFLTTPFLTESSKCTKLHRNWPSRPRTDPKLIQNRPQIDPKPTPNRPQTDPKSTPNRPEIDPKSTPSRPNIYWISVRKGVVRKGIPTYEAWFCMHHPFDIAQPKNEIPLYWCIHACDTVRRLFYIA